MDKIRALIGKMTLDEKIGQLNQVPITKNTKDFSELKKGLREGKIGSLVLSGGAYAGNAPKMQLSCESMNELQKCAAEESRMKIPCLMGHDAIHGFNVINPIPLAMAASFNPELVEESYACTADEVGDGGIRWVFTPMLDVSRDPRWGRCIEGPGEDPYLGSELAKAVINGYQKKGIAACAKHYVGYGASEGGRDYARTEISDYTLHNYYLKAFRAAAEANVATVMSSFNDISGQPTTSSRYLMTDVLRGELGFNGFVVTDWGSVEQLINQGVAQNRAQAAALAINAGIDMDMCSGCFAENLKRLVEENIVTEETIDTAVYRVLKIKEEYGLFDNPYTYAKEYSVEEHLETAYKTASESMVLLKNKDGVLPLKRDINVLLVGPFVNNKRDLLGSWTPTYNIELVKSYAEEIQASYPNVNVHFCDNDLENAMPIGINECDVVIACLGESHSANGELNSLANVELPDGQKTLIREAYSFGKPIIGIMNFGRPIALGDTEPYFSAILYAWQCGSMAAKAALDIIFGKVNPSGRLPMTMIRKNGQIPLYYNFSPSGRAANGYYSLGVGFRNYNDCPGTPLFPFGYGLSYTEFKYGEATVEENSLSLESIENGKKFIISVTVENVGECDGREVVQLYVRDKFSTMTRPIKELKGFEKISLERGEKKVVSFQVGFDELSFYNAEKKFVVEKGAFLIYTGKDCLTENRVEVNVI